MLQNQNLGAKPRISTGLKTSALHYRASGNRPRIRLIVAKLKDNSQEKAPIATNLGGILSRPSGVGVVTISILVGLTRAAGKVLQAATEKLSKAEVGKDPSSLKRWGQELVQKVEESTESAGKSAELISRNFNEAMSELEQNANEANQQFKKELEAGAEGWERTKVAVMPQPTAIDGESTTETTAKPPDIGDVLISKLRRVRDKFSKVTQEQPLQSGWVSDLSGTDIPYAIAAAENAATEQVEASPVQSPPAVSFVDQVQEAGWAAKLLGREVPGDTNLHVNENQDKQKAAFAQAEVQEQTVGKTTEEKRQSQQETPQKVGEIAVKRRVTQAGSIADTPEKKKTAKEASKTSTSAQGGIDPIVEAAMRGGKHVSMLSAPMARSSASTSFARVSSRKDYALSIGNGAVYKVPGAATETPAAVLASGGGIGGGSGAHGGDDGDGGNGGGGGDGQSERDGDGFPWGWVLLFTAMLMASIGYIVMEKEKNKSRIPDPIGKLGSTKEKGR